MRHNRCGNYQVTFQITPPSGCFNTEQICSSWGTKPQGAPSLALSAAWTCQYKVRTWVEKKKKKPLNRLLKWARWDARGAEGWPSTDTGCMVVLPGPVEPIVLPAPVETCAVLLSPSSLSSSSSLCITFYHLLAFGVPSVTTVTIVVLRCCRDMMHHLWINATFLYFGAVDVEQCVLL